AMTRGKARGVVTGTGMDTELGNISAMVSSAEEDKTPINKKLNSLTKKLIYLVLGMAALLGLSSTVTGKETYTIIQTSIAWAIAAIPEGLPIVASIALARGMLRLAKKEVIVKRLEAVETLGETNVILTDKTGTLTENRLNVAHLSWPDMDINLNEEEISREQRDNTFFQHLWKIGIQCNNADYDPEKGEKEASGDPLEIAILRWSYELDKEQTKGWSSAERAAEDPFDSESAMMGVITKEEEGYYISAKGAAASILEQCTHRLTESGEEEMSSEDREHWQKHNDELSNDGLRCLAFACRKTDELPDGADEEDFLHDLVFVGLVGFIDPPQEDVRQAIEESKEAGIRVVMVTGDHPGTAQNVGRQVNITSEEQTKVTQGKDLPDEVSESEAQELVKTEVFSRVDPAQKYQIIESFQKAGYIVGMTGDGVNDAPALKKADIGIAMGLRGTEVAKEVAAMTLKNDHFPSILKAIREGRIIFGNIRKFIVYQLSYHLSEVLVIAAVSFLFFELVLLPLQLLFLNILTDVFPALALGVGEGREGIMKQPPKDPEEPILDRSSWRKIVVYGVVLSIFVFAAFYFVRWQWGAEFALANNVAFFTLAFAQLFHVLDMRDNDEPIFNNQVTRNKYVWMAVAFCTAAILAAYFIPGLSSLLSLPAMPLAYWGVVATAAVGAILSIQVLKSVFKSL
ncbi:MAG TPA: cation-transporting P-type ATPase, partial [Phaeodactylibacter sp.]|nr:cation-transporting P-type ATPase [Phaeodactylibacter sp.]